MSQAAPIPDASAASRRGRWLAAGVLAAALGLRLYAAAVVANEEDMPRFAALAKSVSFAPGRVHLPAGSAQAYHPLLCAYVLKASAACFGWTRLGTRALFVLIAVAGMAPFYWLVRDGFGRRAALAALALMAADQFAVNQAILRLPRMYLSLAPWVLWLFWRAAHAPERGGWAAWLALGAAAGISFLAKESIALLAVGFALFLLTQPRRRRWLRSARLAAALAAALLVASPNLLWNAARGMPNYRRNARKASGLGLTPRPLVLYLGELFPATLGCDRAALLLGDQLYRPWHGPMSPVVGALCLVAACAGVASARRDELAALFAWVFASVFLLSALPAPQQPMNNFWWAGLTVFPAYAFAGRGLAAAWPRSARRRALIVAWAAASLAALAHFLAAREFLDRWWSTRRACAARLVTLADIGPENPADRAAFLRYVKRARPGDPYALACAAGVNLFDGDLDAARRRLLAALALKPNDALFHYALGRLAQWRGRHEEGLAHMLAAQRVAPESAKIARWIGLGYMKLGRPADALPAFRRALRVRPGDADLLAELARTQIALGREDAARRTLQAALASDPSCAAARRLLNRLGRASAFN